MHRTWLSALLLTACSFEGTSSSVDQPTPDAGTTTAHASCDDSDTSLALCLEFENPQPTTIESDGSSFGNNATVANVGMMAGHRAQAARLSQGSSILVAESAALDPSTAVSVELWLQPDGMPDSEQEWWMLDNNTEYGITMKDDGTIHCVIGSDTLDSHHAGVSSDGQWHHAACVYDEQTLEVFVDGQLSACRSLTRAIKTTGSNGTAVGGNLDSNQHLSQKFLGGLDGVRVYTRALSAAGVCGEATGGTSCNASCPSGS